MRVKQKQKYKCNYCKYEFEAEAKASFSKKNGIIYSVSSNTIVCPVCKNSLKTWKDRVDRDYLIMNSK